MIRLLQEITPLLEKNSHPLVVKMEEIRYYSILLGTSFQNVSHEMSLAITTTANMDDLLKISLSKAIYFPPMVSHERPQQSQREKKIKPKNYTSGT